MFDNAKTASFAFAALVAIPLLAYAQGAPDHAASPERRDTPAPGGPCGCDAEVAALQAEVDLLEDRLAELESVIIVDKNGSVSIESPLAVDLKAGVAVGIQAGALIEVDGAQIVFNGGNRPASGVGDSVAPVANQIVTGSAQVLIP